jgi:hypothetical protein
MDSSWCWLLDRRLLTPRLLLQLTEAGQLVNQQVQEVELMRRVLHVHHLLPKLLPERQDLSAELI